MGNPLRTQYTIRRQAKQIKNTRYRKLKWCAAWTPSKIGESGMATSGTHYTVRRQTNIHNTQYEDKQTYKIHSTKTNKHTCMH